jgi:hypothetical protein
MIQILHTSVCATPVLEILHILILGLRCTAAKTSSFPPCQCSRPAFTRGTEPVALKILAMFSNVLQSGFHCWYSTTASLPFPLQKPYTKCMSAYSSFLHMLRILTTITLQHNTATLDSDFCQVTAAQVTPLVRILCFWTLSISCFYIKRSGDWVLSPSSGKTYSVALNR